MDRFSRIIDTLIEMIRKFECRLVENIRMKYKEKKGWKILKIGIRYI